MKVPNFIFLYCAHEQKTVVLTSLFLSLSFHLYLYPLLTHTHAHSLRSREGFRRVKTHTRSLALSLSLSLFQTHTPTRFLWNRCGGSDEWKHTHTLALSLSHTHTHTISLRSIEGSEERKHTQTHSRAREIFFSLSLSLSLTHTHTRCLSDHGRGLEEWWVRCGQSKTCRRYDYVMCVLQRVAVCVAARCSMCCIVAGVIVSCVCCSALQYVLHCRKCDCVMCVLQCVLQCAVNLSRYASVWYVTHRPSNSRSLLQKTPITETILCNGNTHTSISLADKAHTLHSEASLMCAPLHSDDIANVRHC